MRENDLDRVICELSARTSLQTIAPSRRIRSDIGKFESLFIAGDLAFLIVPHTVELLGILPQRGREVDMVRIDADVGTCRELGPDGELHWSQELSIERDWMGG